MKNIPVVSTEVPYTLPEKGEESLEALNKVLKATYATGAVLALVLVGSELTQCEKMSLQFEAIAFYIT